MLTSSFAQSKEPAKVVDMLDYEIQISGLSAGP
jgi:hypothetical protein